MTDEETKERKAGRTLSKIYSNVIDIVTFKKQRYHRQVEQWLEEEYISTPYLSYQVSLYRGNPYRIIFLGIKGNDVCFQVKLFYASKILVKEHESSLIDKATGMVRIPLERFLELLGEVPFAARPRNFTFSNEFYFEIVRTLVEFEDNIDPDQQGFMKFLLSEMGKSDKKYSRFGRTH